MKYLKPKVELDDIEPFRVGGGCTTGCKCDKCFGHLNVNYDYTATSNNGMNRSTSSKFNQSSTRYSSFN